MFFSEALFFCDFIIVSILTVAYTFPHLGFFALLLAVPILIFAYTLSQVDVLASIIQILSIPLITIGILNLNHLYGDINLYLHLPTNPVFIILPLVLLAITAFGEMAYIVLFSVEKDIKENKLAMAYTVLLCISLLFLSIFAGVILSKHSLILSILLPFLLLIVGAFTVYFARIRKLVFLLTWCSAGISGYFVVDWLNKFFGISSPLTAISTYAAGALVLVLIIWAHFKLLRIFQNNEEGEDDEEEIALNKQWGQDANAYVLTITSDSDKEEIELGRIVFFDGICHYKSDFADIKDDHFKAKTLNKAKKKLESIIIEFIKGKTQYYENLLEVLEKD